MHHITINQNQKAMLMSNNIDNSMQWLIIACSGCSSIMWIGIFSFVKILEFAITGIKSRHNENSRVCLLASRLNANKIGFVPLFYSRARSTALSNFQNSYLQTVKHTYINSTQRQLNQIYIHNKETHQSCFMFNGKKKCSHELLQIYKYITMM